MATKPQARKAQRERRITPDALAPNVQVNAPTALIPTPAPTYRPSLLDRASAAHDMREARRLEAEIDRVDEQARKLDGFLNRLLETRLQLHMEDVEGCARPAPGHISIEGFELYARLEKRGASSFPELYLVRTCQVCTVPFDPIIKDLADLGEWAAREERCPRHYVPRPGMSREATAGERALAHARS